MNGEGEQFPPGLGGIPIYREGGTNPVLYK